MQIFQSRDHTELESELTNACQSYMKARRRRSAVWDEERRKSTDLGLASAPASPSPPPPLEAESKKDKKAREKREKAEQKAEAKRLAKERKEQSKADKKAKKTAKKSGKTAGFIALPPPASKDSPVAPRAQPPLAEPVPEVEARRVPPVLRPAPAPPQAPTGPPEEELRQAEEDRRRQEEADAFENEWRQVNDEKTNIQKAKEEAVKREQQRVVAAENESAEATPPPTVSATPVPPMSTPTPLATASPQNGPPAQPNTVEVVLDKGDSKSLGIGLQTVRGQAGGSMVIISSLQANSPAERDGRLQRGLQIMQVDGTVVTDKAQCATLMGHDHQVGMPPPPYVARAACRLSVLIHPKWWDGAVLLAKPHIVSFSPTLVCPQYAHAIFGVLVSLGVGPIHGWHSGAPSASEAGSFDRGLGRSPPDAIIA